VHASQTSPRANDSSTKLEKIAAKREFVSVDIVLAMALPRRPARNPFVIAYEAVLSKFSSSPTVSQTAFEDVLPSTIKSHSE
jgi:hypothetical protein